MPLHNVGRVLAQSWRSANRIPLCSHNYFDQLITNSDFIYYGIEHLAWASTDIFNAIVASNGGVRSGKGYMNIDVNKMKEYVEKETDEYMSEMVSFFYDEED